MTSTPHDALFKAAFENPEDAAGLFRSVLPPTIVQAIAWDTVAGEPGSFIDPELAPGYSDLLFSVELRGGHAFLYLLLEHQSTSDPDMPLRMLVYLVRIWERFRKHYKDEPLPPIIPALVSHAPGGWTAPRSFHEMFDPPPASIVGLAELVPSFTLMVADLAHLSNEDIKARALAAFPTLALWVLRDARDAGQLLDNLGHWGAAFAEAARTPHGVAALAQLMRYIALVSEELQLEAFRAKIREVAPETEQAVMTIAEQIRREVSEKMLREGRLQGRAEVLTKLLVLKFKSLTIEHEARIAGATPEQLDRYVERVLTAETLDEVFEE
jgi:predicted transposase/invertase (TIGR01784 family)